MRHSIEPKDEIYFKDTDFYHLQKSLIKIRALCMDKNFLTAEKN